MGKTIEWSHSPDLVPYELAVSFMERRARSIAQGKARELIWLLEHPPLYTAGTSACDEDLLTPDRFPVYKAGRGGQYTYHGPGQIVAYVMLNLKERGPDVRAFVRNLEDWLIRTLAVYQVAGEIRPDRVGVWVRREDFSPGREDKIAAIGIRLTKWVSFHGVSLNVAPNLEHFSGIVPCGIQSYGVTSLADLGRSVSIENVAHELRRQFEIVFGPTTSVATPSLSQLPQAEQKDETSIQTR